MIGMHAQSCSRSVYIALQAHRTAASTLLLTRMFLLKLRAFHFFPVVCLIPLLSLVSGPPFEVTYTWSLAFENTHPNLHLLIVLVLLLFLFLYLQKHIHIHSSDKTRRTKAKLPWKGHFQTVFSTVCSGKSHGSQGGSLSFSMTFLDLASGK